jgi:hypothetical protein
VFELKRQHGRSKTNLRYLGLTSRAPCTTCNNGWMSGFEKTAKPLLTPAIRGEGTTWSSPEDRTIVARWAFKTALMVDHSGRPELWTAPDKHFSYLFERQEPPPSVSILVGHYLPRPEEEVFVAWADLSRGSGHDFDGDVFHAYRVAFTVGHAIFYVQGYADTDREGRMFDTWLSADGAPLEDVFRRLWPLTPEPHEWPPRGANFATSGLAFLTQGG